MRFTIGDFSPTPKYDDGRLEQALVVGAQYVIEECAFDFYSADILNVQITPDPTGANGKPRDNAFINLTVLKASCLADQWTFRSEAMKEGIRVTAGPTQLGVSGHIKGFQTLLEKGPCAAYEEMKEDYLIGDGVAVQAILGPFVSNKFDPSFLSYNYGYNVDWRLRP